MAKETPKWKDIIIANGVQIQEGQIGQLERYHDLLIDWNTKLNLVSRKDEVNIWPNHILHSISLLFMLTLADGVAIADIGSGGGLPGIPLAVLLPKVEFLMIESIKKKCVALVDMVTKLKIQNARVINGRVEEIGKSTGLRNRFDVILARSVAPLNDLIKWSEPMVRKNAEVAGLNILRGEAVQLPILVAFKGGDVTEEIANARRSASCRDARSHELQFEGIEMTGLSDKKIIIVGLRGSTR